MKVTPEDGTKNDHDLLVGLHTDMQWVKKTLSGHIRQHWAITCICITALVGFLISLKF